MSGKIDLTFGLLMFVLNLIWAVTEQWSVTDLLWSLWLSSLLVGYGYILIATFAVFLTIRRKSFTIEERRRTETFIPASIFNFFLFLIIFLVTGLSVYTLIMFIFLSGGVAVSLNKQIKKKIKMGFIPTVQPAVAILFFMIPITLFLLAFFSINFIGFHLGYSLVLNKFYPLVEFQKYEWDWTGLVHYSSDILQSAFGQYWLFVLFSAFSRLKLYFDTFRASGLATLVLPYKNVSRMHITIFVLAFLSLSQLSNYALYFVFIIYFLPLEDLFRLFFSRKDAPPATFPPWEKPAG